MNRAHAKVSPAGTALARNDALAGARLLLLALIACMLAGCLRPSLHSRESYVFGTRVEVLIWGQREHVALAAADAVLREFDRLHRAFHAWQPSPVSEANAAFAAAQAIEVNDELALHIAAAQKLARSSDYLFDPGIGRLVALWGFHGEEFAARLPDAAALAALQAERPSIADLELDGRMLLSRKRSVALDFGGYLKGVALDRAASILRAQGIDNALINIGGNILALGSKGGTPWRVGIQHPRRPEPLATLALHAGEAIGTSGDYQRFFELEGRRYCHLIDPRSGVPAQQTQALTVLIPPGAESGTRSDALSKPLFILGEDWPAMARRLGVGHVLRIAADGTIEATPQMAERLTLHGGAKIDRLRE